MPSPVTALTATEPGWSPTSNLAVVGRDVGLVEHQQLGHLVGTDLCQHVAHSIELAERIGGAGIDDVHEVVGERGDLERALEGLDQSVRQVAHEPDRVGEQHRLAARQRQSTRGGVERGEQAVLDQHAGVGEQVQQRRLAGVRVADDGDVGEAAAAAALALQRPRCRPVAEVGLELGDAAHDAAPVDFDLGLATTESGADATALLRQVGSLAAPQTWQPVAQQRQLDLRLAFERVGVLTEDVEDHRGAVDRRAARAASRG